MAVTPHRPAPTAGTTPTTPAAAHAPATPPPSTVTPIHTPPVLRSKVIRIIVIVSLIVIAFIGAVIIYFNSKSNAGNTKPALPTTQSNPSMKGTITEVREVSLTADYGEVFYVSDGFNFGFVGATTDYCVVNKDNHIEACGKKGEDVAFKLGEKNPDNRELRFKCSSGKVGSIKIMLVSRD